MTTLRKLLVLAFPILGWTGMAVSTDYGPNTTGDVPILFDAGWNSSNNDISVYTDNPLVNALYEARNLGDGVAGELTITSEGPGNAGLTFGADTRTGYALYDENNVLLRENIVRLAGGATLTGWWNGDEDSPVIGRASLTVEGGAYVYMSGDMEVNDYATLTVTGIDADGNRSYLSVDELRLAGTDAEILVDDYGYLRVRGLATIEEGTFFVADGGVADFRQGVRVDGSTGDALLHLTGGGHIELSGDTIENDPNPEGQGIELIDGGRLVITGTGNSIRDTVYGKSFINNDSGYFAIEGELVADGIYLYSSHSSDDNQYGTEIRGNLLADFVHASGESTTLVDAGGSVLVNDFLLENSARFLLEGNLVALESLLITGGTLTMGDDGVMAADDIRMSAGRLDISGLVVSLTVDGTMLQTGGTINVMDGGELAATAFQMRGGVLSVASGGVISSETVNVGGGTMTVDAGGAIAAGTEFGASGGTVNFTNGSDIGGTAGLGVLRLSSEGLVNVHTSLRTQNLHVNGGTLNLSSGTVTVLTGFDTTMGGGTIALAGGNLTFNGTFNVSGGTVAGRSEDSAISLGNNALSVGANGTIDASEANIGISGVTDFTLTGTYIAGEVNGLTTMLSVTGMGGNNGVFTITPGNDQVQLSRDLQVRVNSADLSGGYLVMSTDALTYTGDTTLVWDDDFYGTYTYQVLQDANTGEYGIYVTGSVARSREEQRESIRSSWREHPEVGNSGVDNVLNPSMIDAIIDGTAIRIGREDGYDNLSHDGQFNVGVLSTLVSPKSGTYDALMLYNGSGLGMVNSAIINNSQATLKRLTTRNTFIRREMDQACVLLNPGCDFEYEEPDFEPANRVWATGNYTSDSSGHKDGFAGYKYRGKGLVIGYDRVMDRLALGIAGSYMGGSFKDQAALSNNSTINTYGIYGYGNYSAENGLFIGGAMGYAYSYTKLRDYRVLDGAAGWNSGDFGADSFLAAINLGKDVWLSDTLAITPSVGMTYIDTHTAAHSQYFAPNGGGRGANTINADAIKGHSFQIPLDLAISGNWDLEEESSFTLTANIGYAYELNNKGAHGYINYGGLGGVVGPVKIASRNLGRHIVNLGLNGKYSYRNYEFGFGYDYTGKQKYSSHNFLLSAGIVF